MLHEAVLTKLKELGSQSVYFEPLGGNNGDDLIEMGAMCVMKYVGIKLVPTPEEAEVIVINGSGDLSYHPRSKPIEDTRQASLLMRFRDKQVILLPSSSTQVNAARMIDVLKDRKATTVLFTRDAISYGLLKSLEGPQVEVMLDHDMAFGLHGSKFIEELKKKTSSGPLLIVERFDTEGATKPPAIYRTPVFFRSLIPSGLKNFIKKKTLGAVHKGTPFISEATGKVKELFPAVQYNDIKAADISLPQNHTFEEFADAVAGASVVVSTRLHVCVLAALLGKPFVAVQFEGGNKLSGVFKQSLESFQLGKLWIRSR